MEQQLTEIKKLPDGDDGLLKKLTVAVGRAAAMFQGGGLKKDGGDKILVRSEIDFQLQSRTRKEMTLISGRYLSDFGKAQVYPVEDAGRGFSVGVPDLGRHEGLSRQLQALGFLRRQHKPAAEDDGSVLRLELGVQIPPLQRPLLLGAQDPLRLEDPVEPHGGDPPAADPHRRVGRRPDHEPPRARRRRSRHQEECLPLAHSRVLREAALAASQGGKSVENILA